MIKKLLPSVFLLIASISLHAQGQADKWYFGQNAYVNFTSGSPVAGTGPLQTSEGTASISNASGAVLFYTNGVDVWDNTGALMSNGTGLMGDISSTQSAMIVPVPGSNSQYYIFTTAADGGTTSTVDFRYSVVDMTLNGGFGDVTGSKNISITDSTTEKIAAINDGSGGYWVLMHKWNDNAFYSYHLTSGAFPSPVVSYAGSVHSNSMIQNTYGQMKFNMCGTKLALAIGYQNTIELFDFDKTTGVVSNPVSLAMPDHVYGIEFSKSGNFLYATCYDPGGKLVQFSCTLGTASLIMASKVTLSTTDDLYGLQMGPNGKIYVSRSFGTSYLGQINSPDLAGLACNYTDLGLDLDPAFMGINGALSLPSFPQNFIASALGVTCPGVGIDEVSYSDTNPVFPNPSSDEFSIALTNATITLYDCTGKLLQQKNELNGTFRFGKELPKGIYLLNVAENGKRYSIRTVKM